jgi:ATP-dependent DNA ligase
MISISECDIGAILSGSNVEKFTRLRFARLARKVRESQLPKESKRSCNTSKTPTEHSKR